jgi:putative peptidoglycan lipid II flippase
MIATLLWKGPHSEQARLAELLAIGSVIGSALQFGVQLPAVLRFLWPIEIHVRLSEHVRTVVKNFTPVFISRGVVQISAYVDSFLASFLPDGAVAALGYAQTLYTLPVSLFGMSVSAAELPAMSSVTGTSDEIAAALRGRLARGLEQISFFVVPSAMAFLALGDVVVATLYRSGKFGHDDVIYVWAVLAGSAVGLLASTSGRLFSSAFYALRNTRTPLNFAIIRVALTLGLGYICALKVPGLLHVEPRWGTVGLTLSAGVAGWVEFVLLRRALQERIGKVPYSAIRILKLWAATLIAAAAGYGTKLALPMHDVSTLRRVLIGICILGVYGMGYLVITQLMGISTITQSLAALRGRRK